MDIISFMVQKYNSSVEITDVINSAKNCKDKDRCNESLLVYGHGDGGGGT